MSGIEKTEKQVDDLTPIETTRRGSVSGRPPSIVDPVFGQISEDGPNYRSVRPSFTSCLTESNIF